MRTFAAIFFSFVLLAFGFGCSHNKNAAENGTEPTATTAGAGQDTSTSATAGSQGAGSQGTTTGTTDQTTTGTTTGADQESSTTAGTQAGNNATEPSMTNSTTTDSDRSDPRAGATTSTGEQKPDQIQTDQQTITAPGGANDPALQASVEKVIQDQGLSNVKASVDQGVVILTGTVASQDQATYMVNTVKAMQDVKEVRSQLSVQGQ